MEKVAVTLGFKYEGLPYVVTFSVSTEKWQRIVTGLETVAESLAGVLIVRWNLDANRFELQEVIGIRTVNVSSREWMMESHENEPERKAE